MADAQNISHIPCIAHLERIIIVSFGNKITWEKLCMKSLLSLHYMSVVDHLHHLKDTTTITRWWDNGTTTETIMRQVMFSIYKFKSPFWFIIFCLAIEISHFHEVTLWNNFGKRIKYLLHLLHIISLHTDMFKFHTISCWPIFLQGSSPKE